MSGFTHTSCVQNHSISYSRSNSNSAREVIKDDEGTDDCPLSSKKAKVTTLVSAMYSGLRIKINKAPFMI